MPIGDYRDALASTGTRIDRLIAVGGGFRSGYWLKVIATALNYPVDIPEAGDFGGAYGATRLALLAASGAGREGITPPTIARSFDPDPDSTAAFDDGHRVYRRARDAVLGLSAPS